MTRWLRLTALLPALWFVAACSTNPATGKQSFTAFMSKEDELRIGAEEHPKMIKEFGGAYTDAKLRAYIRRIGIKLAAVSESRDLPFTFTILNDDKVNAFALPGGYVYITRGLLALAENEAEMAGVLAHEIGHVAARHTAERYSTAMATNLGLMVLGAIGSQAGLPSGVGRIIGIGAQAALQGYSRDQELEADMLGVRYMTRVGYSPDGMTSFFYKMQAHAGLERAMEGKKGGAENNIMSTHPRTAQRITQAIGLAKTAPVRDPVLGRGEFMAEIDGMVFGDDPEQGVRRGRTFTHPELRIEFRVPPEFILFNSPRQVVARGPNHSVVIFDMAPDKTARNARSLRGYIANTWASGLALRGLEGINVNGMDSATAEARISTPGGPRDLRLVAIRGSEGRIFRLAFISPPEMTARLSAEFRRTTWSFRRISEAEAKAIKPLKIRVVPVKDGDTMLNLASRMPLGKFSRQWFETMNRNALGRGLATGSDVKTVEK
jgi:predicted Zn-dependent protease